MSACPSLSLSCDNLSCNIWFCCGSAKDPDQHDDCYLPKQQQQQQPAPQHHPPSTQPPPRVVAAPGYAPPSDLVPPHQVSPGSVPKPPVATPHGTVPPCCDKGHEPPTTTIPATLPSKKHKPIEAREPPATIIPAVAPPKRYEDPHPAWTAVAPRAPVPPYQATEPAAATTKMPIPTAVPSTRNEPPQPAWTATPRAPVQPKEPPVRPPPARVASKKYETPPQPSARTTWTPPRVPSNTYDEGVWPAVPTMRPPVPHRIYEPPALAVAPPQPARTTAPRARASQYPPEHHPHHDDASFRVESSYSQAHLEEYY